MQRYNYSETEDVAELIKNIWVEFWPQMKGTGKRESFFRPTHRCGLDVAPKK